MNKNISIEKPEYKNNYSAGYVGFTYTDNSFVSNGIIFFTQKLAYWLKVSHCFLVRDEEHGLEATLTRKVNGVHKFKLQEYFNNPHCHVFFCKPIELCDDYTNTILIEAKKHIGKKYDLPLFGGFILRWILRPLEALPCIRLKPSIFDSSISFICSEYVSTCLKQIPLYRQIEPLKGYHESKINPQMLFHSNLWKEWTYRR